MNPIAQEANGEIYLHQIIDSSEFFILFDELINDQSRFFCNRETI